MQSCTMTFQPSHAKIFLNIGPMDVMSPSKDALRSPLSINNEFYNIIMRFEGVRAEKQKWDVTKCHLV